MPATLHCPLDGGELSTHPHGASRFHQCTDCSGIWVSRMFLQGLAFRRDDQLMGGLETLPAPVHRDEPISCPGCGFLMLQRQQHGVQVDLCPDCKSLWLDGGEVIHIGTALRGTEAKRTKKRLETSNREARRAGVPTYSIGSEVAAEGILSLIAAYFLGLFS